MTENMKKYLELVSTDEELQKKIAKAEAEYKEKLIKDAIKLAGEHGITLTEADFATETPSGELSDDELDAVAGGNRCYCGIGGGGSRADYGDNHDKTCACVLGGGGEYAYSHTLLDGTVVSEKGMRCVCTVAGYGDTFVSS